MPRKDNNNISPISAQTKLSIEGIAYGGKGIAKKDSKVYFVEQAVPGDVVICKLNKDKPRFSEASVLTIETKSPLRTTSHCKYSDECGGCQWQDIPYEQQLVWKKQFVQESLQKIARLESHQTIIVEPSPKIQGYRNRILLRGTIKPDGSIGVGYFKASTHEQMHISHCLIASQPLNSFIEKISSHKTLATPQKFRIELQELPARSVNSTASIFAIVTPADGKTNSLKQLVDELQDFEEILWIGLSYEAKEAPVAIFEEDALKYFTSPGQFLQVNTLHNHSLRNEIATIVDRLSPKVIADLYCGSGNLSLILADGTRRIDGFEFNKIAIRNAKINTRENNLHNIRYHAYDALQGFKRLVKSGGKPDLLIVDPPRKGMAEVTATILEPGNEPNYIIYVSCDPTTLARDIKALADAYEMIEIKCFDFFPNTYHIETVCLLKKIN
ncbi:MAG: 23S rRNA (uracil(1939)-C(5))-methyltransferase RlmD [Bdellovibrionota bacterium]